MPQRIQRSRAKGWRKPENTVDVTRPGWFGNPWSDPKRHSYSPEEAIERFRILTVPNLPVHLLRGKNLMCWCPLDQPCHADVLLELANAAAAALGADTKEDGDGS